MAEAKRYYWLKFKEDFFDSKRIKKLRKMAGGDTYVIIYLKMQLKALKTDGMLEFTGVEQDFADELALDIDESPDDVRVVLTFLLTYGMCECSDNIHYYFPYVIENTGSETASTQRVRDYRERQKALHCNADVTQVKRIGNVEKEIEKEIEIESRDREKNNTLTLTGSSVCATTGPSQFYLDFERFWKAYPKKRNKETARRAFKKLKGVSIETLLEAIEKQKRSQDWLKDGGQYIPYPATWLNAGGWENEVGESSDGLDNLRNLYAMFEEEEKNDKD